VHEEDACGRLRGLWEQAHLSLGAVRSLDVSAPRLIQSARLRPKHANLAPIGVVGSLLFSLFFVPLARESPPPGPALRR